MRLTINNIARVRHAELDLNGITVIVGDNNAGKTTIGRCLYSFFNSLHDMEGKVGNQRERQWRNAYRSFLDEYRLAGFFVPQISDVFNAYMADSNNSGEAIADFLQTRYGEHISRDEIQGFIGRLSDIRGFTDDEIRRQIVFSYFSDVFSDQFLPADKADSQGVVGADLKGRKFVIRLRKDSAEFEAPLNIQHCAYYIESPDLLNYWGRYRPYSTGMLSVSFRKAVRERFAEEDRTTEHVMENLELGKRYKTLSEKISGVVNGEVSLDSNLILHYDDGAFKGVPIEVGNVSEGVKAFGVLQLALSQRVFKPKDVLILDEPEVHLHPMWQLEYARLIVLLQQEFDLTILLTTHSSSFMVALQLYALKYGRSKAVNSYRIGPDSEDSRFSVVKSEDSFDWDEAYLSFVKAAAKLRELREEVYGQH